VEKRRPTYDLGAFKAAVAVDKASFTRTAIHNARALGFGYADMKAAIATMGRTHFYKSMTSHADHRLWQDVYHLPCEGLVLYVKFTADVVTEFAVLSFKER
jgi:motility quorum-sensing regulator/GCU-specific mRNA interferase toxin